LATSVAATAEIVLLIILSNYRQSQSGLFGAYQQSFLYVVYDIV
jgi:hypothetical protein